MTSILQPLLLHSSVAPQTAEAVDVLGGNTGWKERATKAAFTNKPKSQMFILWAMAIFLLCLTGPMQQVCNLGSWVVLATQGKRKNHRVLQEKHKAWVQAPNSSYTTWMFGPRGSCVLNTVEGRLRPAGTSHPLFRSLLTTQAAQVFTTNAWAVQSCGINHEKAEKQDKVAKALFPQNPPGCWGVTWSRK